MRLKFFVTDIATSFITRLNFLPQNFLPQNLILAIANQRNYFPDENLRTNAFLCADIDISSDALKYDPRCSNKVFPPRRENSSSAAMVHLVRLNCS